MCGIIGYIGKKENPKIGIEALKRLEYRGYDSAGIAVFNPKKNKIFFLKTIGKISVLEKEFKKQAILGSPFILHTRWGTHGKITQENAHPHFDCNKNIFLVHNGIVENFVELKKDLIKKGHKFISETDTEVISHLIEDFMNKNLKLEEAVRKALKLIRGSYALAIISKDDPQKIIAASLSSPLTIGVNKDEYFLASDSTALAPFTKKIINLEDNEIAVLTKNDFYILKEKATQPLEIKSEKNNKQGYPHFMLKEIMEQPQSLEDSINGRIILDKGLAKLGGLESVQKELKKIKKLNIIACGSSYYTGLISKYIIEEYAKIPVEVDFASEFRYRKPVLDKKTAFLMISQSGETADTIATLKDINKKGILTLAIVNVVGSTISRESTAGIYNHIGPEIGVASTKSFTSQLAILDLLMLFLSRERDITKSEGKKIAKNLSEVPELVKRILKKSSQIKKLAEKYKDYENFLFLGRKYNYPIALEGALKLKEIAYLPAQGYGAGEMKHGPIALINEDSLVIAICPKDSVYKKMISNIQEVKTRNGKVLAITTEDNKDIKKIADDVIYIPKTLEILMPILNVIPLQFFAYYMGLLHGCDVDKPRNLAKSVTVE